MTHREIGLRENDKFLVGVTKITEISFKFLIYIVLRDNDEITPTSKLPKYSWENDEITPTSNWNYVNTLQV